MRGRPTARDMALAVATAAFLFAASGGRAASAAAMDDPLARPEFDQEISLQLDGQEVATVFRTIARLVQVRFLLEFERDPSLRVNLSAENMVCRGILESLASSYDLEYSASAQGLVVRRRGVPPSAPTAVGPRPDFTYWFELAVRDPSGRNESFPRLRHQPGSGEPMAFSLTGRPDTTVPGIHPRFGTIERRSVGAFELTLIVKTDAGNSLELAAELVTHRNLGDRRYVATHAITTATVGASEQVLFRTEEGMEIVLTAWGRSARAAAAARRGSP
jgi:hypothetical protein